MFVGADVGVLHDVFGLAVIAQNRARDAVQPLVITAHDDFKQGSFARQNPLYDIFVAHFALLRFVEVRWNDGADHAFVSSAAAWIENPEALKVTILRSFEVPF